MSFLLLNFRFAQSDEDSLAVLTYAANNVVWHAFEIDENIVCYTKISSTEYYNPDNSPGKPQLILDINVSTELVEIVKHDVSAAYVINYGNV